VALAFLGVGILAGPVAWADLKVPEHAGVTPVNVSKKVEWGGSLEIRMQLAVPRKQKTLMGEGNTPEFEFFIRRPPLFGQLGEVRQLPAGDGSDAALVLYQNTGWPDGELDVFEFAARGRNGVVPVSGVVQVRILRGRLEVGSGSFLHLGVVPSSESISGTVLLRNAGSARLSFSARVSGEGYSLQPPSGGVIEPRASQSLSVDFKATKKEGESAGELIIQELPPSSIISSQRVAEVRRIALSAMVGSPFDAAPARLKLQGGTESVRAEASFTVRNLLRTPVTIEVRVPDPFVAQVEGLKLTGSGSGSVGVRFKKDTPPGEYRGAIELVASGYSHRIAVEGVVPTLARLTVSGGNPVWVLPGAGVPVPMKALEIQNAGEQTWSGSVEVDSPFSVDQTTLRLPPGAVQTVNLTATLPPRASGIIGGALRFSGETHLSVPLRMEVGNAVAAPPVPQVSPAPPSPVPPAKPGPSVGRELRTAVQDQPEAKSSSSAVIENLQAVGDFELRGLKAEPVQTGVVQVSWRPDPPSRPEEFRLLLRRLQPVLNENKLQYTLTPLEDVPCKVLSSGRYSFEVDRMRSSWGYAFQVERLSSAGDSLGVSSVVSVSTPKWPELEDDVRMPWGLIVAFLGGGVAWFGWRRRRKKGA
jgi:hypothetical protein